MPDETIDLSRAGGRLGAGTARVLDWLDTHRDPLVIRPGDAALLSMALDTLFREVIDVEPQEEESDQATWMRGYLYGFKDKVRAHLGVPQAATDDEGPARWKGRSRSKTPGGPTVAGSVASWFRSARRRWAGRTSSG